MVRINLLALALLQIQGAISAAISTIVRCGNDEPATELLAQANAFRKSSQIRPLAFGGTISVNTYFHVVASSNGSVTSSQLTSQLGVLNRSYNPYGISFDLVSSDFTVNSNWATGNFDSEMKPALRKGTYQDLNVYFLTDLAAGSLGVCPFPTATSGAGSYDLDGCKVAAQSVPGGSLVNFNQGGTATHEIGHWFGLFHVFQGQACSGAGDMVDDTPIQSTATSGCPASKDTCPLDPGEDNIHNYMDYSYDICYNQFTDGQAARIFDMYALYRAGR